MAERFRGYLPVVIDVETGGFNCATDALLEIAATTIGMDEQGFVFPEHTHFFRVEPFEGANIEAAALEFTGIKLDHPLRMAVSEEAALTDIFRGVRKALKANGCKRAILVGHNSSFDLGFLNAAVARLDMKRNPFHPFSSFDTATLAGLAYGQTVLAKACQAAGIDFDGREAHSARYDTEKTAELFCGILASVLGQVSRNAFWRSVHAFVAFFPVGRANFAVLFVELQGVDQADQLFHVTAQWQVVNDLGANNAFVVDQECATERHAAFGLNVVGLGDVVLQVGSHGVFDFADAAIIDGSVAPGVVGEMGVDGNGNHFNVTRLEIVHAVVQGDQLRRADEGEVQRVEEHQAVFAFDGFRQFEAVYDFAIAEDGRYVEIRGLFADEYAHWVSPDVGVTIEVKGPLPSLPCISDSPVTRSRFVKTDHHTLKKPFVSEGAAPANTLRFYFDNHSR
ncbi:hypothetical protein BHE74_00001304 [Ensete ventricosum]|nr:hypothetical protein BHE74_00001304 [Ensete ventricosum]